MNIRAKGGNAQILTSIEVAAYDSSIFRIWSDVRYSYLSMSIGVHDRCHPNNQKLRESYWSFQLKTFDKGLNGHLPLPSKQTVRQHKKVNEISSMMTIHRS